MDIKRARFRADSTIHDDKLTSCLELNCHHTRPSRTSRKRSRPSNLHESGTDSEEDVSEGEKDSGLDEIVLKEEGVSAAKKKKRLNKKGKAKPKPKDIPWEVEMDTPLNDSASAPGSPKPKSTSPSKPKSRAKPRSSSEKPISAKSMKPRSKPRKSSASGMEVTSGASEAEGIEGKPKKKRKV
jgi:hypothetical protein